MRSVNGYGSRPLQMGCPEKCEHRTLVLQEPSIRARYELCRKWNEAT